MMQEHMTNEYALPFAAWELRLYLNTHPDDERALAAYKQLCAAQGDKCNYACSVGEFHTTARNSGVNTAGCGCAYTDHAKTHTDGRVWHWIDGPWPWEPEANIKEGC